VYPLDTYNPKEYILKKCVYLMVIKPFLIQDNPTEYVGHAYYKGGKLK